MGTAAKGRFGREAVSMSPGGPLVFGGSRLPQARLRHAAGVGGATVHPWAWAAVLDVPRALRRAGPSPNPPVKAWFGSTHLFVPVTSCEARHLVPPKKMPSRYVERRPPSAFSYELTGSLCGWASMDAHDGTLTVSSRSSRNQWDADVRVRVTAVGGVLHCVPRASTTLVDDLGAPWGALVVEGDSIRVVDVDGATRVEVAPLRDQPREGSAILSGSHEVRVLSADGFPVPPRPTWTP